MLQDMVYPKFQKCLKKYIIKQLAYTEILEHAHLRNYLRKMTVKLPLDWRKVIAND